jgi:hypothetical protein
MLQDIRSDTIATFLLQKSNLTEVQLDTILASEEIGSLDFKRGLREKHKVSKGSFARTLKQAHENVEASIYTIFLLSYLDLVRPESVGQFIRNTRMLGELKNAKPRREDLLKVIEAMEGYAQSFAKGKQKLIV